MPTYITLDLVPPVSRCPPAHVAVPGLSRGTLGAPLTHRCRRHARTPSANVASYAPHPLGIHLMRDASASCAMGLPRITIAQLRLST